MNAIPGLSTLLKNDLMHNRSTHIVFVAKEETW